MLKIEELERKILKYDFNVKEYNYIGEDDNLINIIKKSLDEAYITVIKCPQGLGKTNFMCNMLDKSVLFLTPTRALADEVNIKYEKMNGIFGFNEDSLTCSKKNIDELLKSDSVVSTYSSSVAVLNKTIDSFDVLVIDEAHMIVRSLDYAYDHYDNVLHCIVEFLKKGKKVIMMSATPETLFSFYKDYKDAVVKNKIRIINIKPTVSKKYIETLFIYKKLNLDSLYTLIKNNWLKGRKQVVLINNKEHIKTFIASFRKDEIKYKCIERDNITEAMDNDGLMSADIIIGTSVIECGLNFNDENITDLYCVFDNKWLNGEWDIILQFMARARKAKPNLHIVYPVCDDYERNLFESYLEFPQMMEKVLNAYTKQLVNFSNHLLAYYDAGFIPDSSLAVGQAIVKSSNGKYSVDSIKAWHYLYKIYTKLIFDSILDKIAFYETKSVVYSIEENEQLEKTQYIMEILDGFSVSKEEHTQDEWKDILSKYGIKFKQLKSFVKNYPPYSIETDKHRRSRMYRIVNSLRKN